MMMVKIVAIADAAVDDDCNDAHLQQQPDLTSYNNITPHL
jgi:hypothetical protein